MQAALVPELAPVPAPSRPKAAGSCRCCNRRLTNPRWVREGIGPVCFTRPKCNPRDQEAKPVPVQTEDDNTLPFDPLSGDVVIRRKPGGWGLITNVPHRHVHHSPTGYECGYGGSGPADLALNILALFVGPAPDPGPMPGDYAPDRVWDAWQEKVDQAVSCGDGSVVHSKAWELHQDFKWEVVARLPREGGVITGERIRAWLRANGVEPVI